MINNSNERQLSPLSKDVNLIGKLVAIHSENPQHHDSPIHQMKTQSNTVGINTSKLKKWVEDQDNVKPVTHFKMHSSVYKVNVHNNSQELSKTQNKRPNLVNISRKVNTNNCKKSPIGSIIKQEIRQRSVPISPKMSQPAQNYLKYQNTQVTSPQLPHINKIQKNIKGFSSFIGGTSTYKNSPFKNSYSQRHTPSSKKHLNGVGKTYTASMFSTKYDPEQQQSLQHPKKISKLENSRIKLPITQDSPKRQTKQVQQQTVLCQNQLKSSTSFPAKQEEQQRYFQQQNNLTSSNIHGFIYNRNPSSQYSVSIDLRIPISRIKQLLVEGGYEMFVSFVIPEIFFLPPSPETTSQQLHLMMLQAFSHLDMTPQIVSIKKYVNCVVMRDKKLCILWNYNGKVYFGGWDKNNMLTQGNKHGIGLQWVPARYIYYGEFKNNRKEGYGIMKKANKQVYVGCWKNNQRNGWGRLYDYDGQLCKNGEFVDGSFVYPRRQNS